MTLRITIAAPFRHTRKSGMRKNELVYYYALDRKWMSTEQAGQLLARAEKDGLLALKDGVYTPLFDIQEMTIPIGYKPSSAIFKDSDPAQELIMRIAQSQGMQETAVVSEMNRMIREEFDGNLLPAAALVILAKKYNVAFMDQRDALAATIQKR